MILKEIVILILLLSSVISEDDEGRCFATHTKSGNMTIIYDEACDPFRLDWAYPMLDGKGTGLTIHHKWKDSASEFLLCLKNDGYTLDITAKNLGFDGEWHEADFGNERGATGTCIISMNSEITLYLESLVQTYITAIIYWTVEPVTRQDDTNDCKDSHWRSGNMTIMYDKACDPFRLEWHYPMLDAEGTGFTIYHNWKDLASEFRICLMNDGNLDGITAKYEGSDGVLHEADFGHEEDDKGTCINSLNSEITLYLQASSNVYIAYVSWTVEQIDPEDDIMGCKDIHWTSGNMTITYDRLCDPFRMDWYYPMLDGEGTGLTIYHKWKDSASEFRICLLNEGFIWGALAWYDDPYEHGVQHEANFGQETGDVGTCIMSFNSEITLHLQTAENVYMFMVHWTVFPEYEPSGCDGQHYVDLLQLAFVTCTILIILAIE